MLASGAAVPAVPSLPTPAPLAEGGSRVGAAAASVSTRLSFRLPATAGEQYTPNARNIALRSSKLGPLLLFLPATRAVPRDYRSFLDTASASGYHVLALDYWNLGSSVARTCGVEAACYGQVQANRFDGSHPSRFSHIEKSDSIVARLRHALTILAQRDPSGEWSQYLDDSRIRWRNIVLAGHSQGGGESAFIAHSHLVHGVLLFASPVASEGRVVATWMTTKGVTPVSRYYGLDSSRDMYFPRIQGSWSALGIGGATPPTRITDRVPFASSHRLISTMDLGTAGQSHSRMIADDGPRTSAGVPQFQPVWEWMLKAVRGTTAPS